MTENLDTYEKIDAAHMEAVNKVAVAVGNAALALGLSTEAVIAKVAEACQPIDAWRDAAYLRIEGRLN